MPDTTRHSQPDASCIMPKQLVSRRKTVIEALAPTEPLDFDWEPARPRIIARTPDFDV
jgi:hypothetical protein